jgi:hypothetical protein
MYLLDGLLSRLRYWLLRGRNQSREDDAVCPVDR